LNTAFYTRVFLFLTLDLVRKKGVVGRFLCRSQYSFGPIHLFDVLGTCDRISAQQFIFTLGLLFNSAIGMPIFALVIFGKEKNQMLFF
jgi:hypothetical protein